MFRFTLVYINVHIIILCYNISSTPSNRKYFGGDQWQRFLCHTAERDGAVKGVG